MSLPHYSEPLHCLSFSLEPSTTCPLYLIHADLYILNDAYSNILDDIQLYICPFSQGQDGVPCHPLPWLKAQLVLTIAFDMVCLVLGSLACL